MAARASLLDISAQFAQVAEQVPEALARVHFTRIADPEGQISILLGNVHQFDAQEGTKQSAILNVISRVVDRWGRESQHVIVGGDWNGSLHTRDGYVVGSGTAAADARLATWVNDTGLFYLAPENSTWTDGTRRAALDAFILRDKCSLDHLACIRSTDPRHDHLGLQAIIVDENLDPMPELESMRRTVRLKLEGLRDKQKRQEYIQLTAEAVGRVRASKENLGVFEYLEAMKSAVLKVAKETLGTRGGEIRPLLPRHSGAFQRLATLIRLLRVVRREILEYRGSERRHASKAMIRLWHRCQEVYPEGTSFRALGDLVGGDAGWSRHAAAGLRARIHTAEEELRQLRRLETKEAAERRRQAATDDFWSGGGLRRFLHPPSPSLHSSVLRGQVTESVTIQGTESALQCLQQGNKLE
jgi:hypothetical protein